MDNSDNIGRKFSWVDRLVVCKECRHVAKDQARHEDHFKEAMHIHWIRNQAYMDPKKRSMWLRIWFSTVEKVEQENPWALAFDEQEELVEVQ